MSRRREFALVALGVFVSSQAFAGTTTTPLPTANRGLFISGDVGCAITMSVSGGGAWLDGGDVTDGSYVYDDARLGSIVLGVPASEGNPGIGPTATYGSAYQDVGGGTNVFTSLAMSVSSTNCVTTTYDITIQYVSWTDGTIEFMIDDGTMDFTDRSTADFYIPTADSIEYHLVDDATFVTTQGGSTSYSWQIGVGLDGDMASGHFYAQTQLNLVTNY